ncbi:hypothetical protein CC1G_00245 [Coprinopsis cinerea okayama7|uniref:WIBG Mago-binding domain-containing protein n=1 Tax=Coprinopsis cinerea (strain Okayama-7 / 130 / ATCC MYA-4618 / FGSC 9003) TaxID=240176 RepID=A8NXA1_COPC7|nr:hypothetical protein CC1G_00245 [Coprinopsis cinerea okayama7\|eukprot:XP_001837109.1 hypothetical protein CC1G_00245 [Coprinopsis cinerea okayama7\
MSLPPIDPKKSVAGIAVDPQTLERVVPESRRPDGSVRKQLKIRPGFTPQEDVQRFRGTRQAQADANKLPKGHIIGWAPPTASETSTSKPMSKGAKKNAKRKEKKEKERAEAAAAATPVRDNWEDDSDGEQPGAPTTAEEKKDPPPATTSESTDSVTNKLEKLTI